MSNPIKVSTSSTDFPSLKLKDYENANRFIYVGSRLYPYGPSNSSGFYAGVTPQEGKYVIYKVTGNDTFLIYAPANDTELELATKQLYPTAWGTAPSLELIKKVIQQNLFNRDYENIVLSGLTFAIDSSFWPSVCSNTSIKDISKNTLNISSSITYNSGSTFDNAFIELDGTDDFLTVNIPANTNSSEGNTFEFWIFKPESSGLQTLLSFFGYNLSISFSGGTFGLYNGNSSFYGLNFSNFSNWTHCVFYIPNNWSTNYSNTKIWINGIEQTITVDTGNYQSVNFGSTLICYFGKAFYTTFNTYYYLGSLSVIRSYDRELTNDEVIHNFNEQKTRYGFSSGIVTNGLIFDVDAGNTSSYPGSGTTWTDLIGDNDGTLTNGPTYDSRNGGSIVFDGANDYVNFGDLDLFNFTSSSQFTFNFWYRTTTNLSSDSTILTLCDKSVNNFTNGFAFWLRGSNTYKGILFRVRRPEGQFDLIPSTNISSIVSNGVYHFISVTYSNSNFKMYFDSNIVGSLESTPSFDFTNNSNFHIGTSQSSTTFPFEGNISNGIIYNRALTADEVLQNYNALKGRYGFYEDVVTDGLVFVVDAGNTYSYPGSGTTWTDLIGDNDGTLTNGPTFDSENGGSIVFDGSDDYVDCGPSNTIGSSLSSATWSAWFKSTQTNSIGYITALKRLPLGTASSLFSIILNRQSTSTTPANGYLSLLSMDGTNFNYLPHNGSYNDGNWYNVVGVVTPTNRTLYVNGQSVATDSNGGFSNVSDNTEPFTIGAFGQGSFEFDGNISNASFYNRALSANEVLQNYNALKERYGY